MTDLLAECSVRARSRILFGVYLGQLEACAPISGFGAFSLLRLRLARVTSVHDLTSISCTSSLVIHRGSLSRFDSRGRIHSKNGNAFAGTDPGRSPAAGESHRRPTPPMQSTPDMEN